MTIQKKYTLWIFPILICDIMKCYLEENILIPGLLVNSSYLKNLTLTAKNKICFHLGETSIQTLKQNKNGAKKYLARIYKWSVICLKKGECLNFIPPGLKI